MREPGCAAPERRPTLQPSASPHRPSDQPVRNKPWFKQMTNALQGAGAAALQLPQRGPPLLILTLQKACSRCLVTGSIRFAHKSLQ